MKFIINYFNQINLHIYKTAFYLAVEKENIEIIKLFFKNKKFNVNAKYILNKIHLLLHSLFITSIKFEIKYYNSIQYQKIQSN